MSVTYCKAQGSALIDPGTKLSRTVNIPYYKEAPDNGYSTDGNGCDTVYQNDKKIQPICLGDICTQKDKIAVYDYSKAFCEIPHENIGRTYFKLNLSFRGNTSPNRQESQLNFYINGLGIAGGTGNQRLAAHQHTGGHQRTQRGAEAVHRLQHRYRLPHQVVLLRGDEPCPLVEGNFGFRRGEHAVHLFPVHPDGGDAHVHS